MIATVGGTGQLCLIRLIRKGTRFLRFRPLNSITGWMLRHLKHHISVLSGGSTIRDREWPYQLSSEAKTQGATFDSFRFSRLVKEQLSSSLRDDD